MDKDAEIARLKQWVNDLQSGMYINCVYCGHRYGPQDEVPSSMADVLKEHVEQCPEHPMSALKTKVRELQEELGACATQINCAGPVSHRIRILRKEHGEHVHKLLSQIEILKKSMPVEELQMKMGVQASSVLADWIREACVEIYGAIPPNMGTDLKDCNDRFCRISNVVANVALETESVCSWQDPTGMSWVLDVLGESRRGE